MLNRILGRKGKVWSDRFHARALETPREVRNALVYVLMNIRKHARTKEEPGVLGLDPYSSAQWFGGWDPRAGPFWLDMMCAPMLDEPCPVVAPRTWLASTGWRRHGLIGPLEAPRAA